MASRASAAALAICSPDLRSDQNLDKPSSTLWCISERLLAGHAAGLTRVLACTAMRLRDMRFRQHGQAVLHTGLCLLTLA